MTTLTKTFKIGEYCVGGVITVNIKKKSITIICKDWDYSKGSKGGSSQKNAKEISRITVNDMEYNSHWKLTLYLSTITTAYYSDQVIEYIENNMALN